MGHLKNDQVWWLPFSKVLACPCVADLEINASYPFVTQSHSLAKWQKGLSGPVDATVFLT